MDNALLNGRWLGIQPGMLLGSRQGLSLHSTLVRQKLSEMEQRKRQMERMQHILEEALRHEHLTVEEAIHLFQPID